MKEINLYTYIHSTVRLMVYLVKSRRQSFLHTSSIFQHGDILTILYHLSVCHNLKITITCSARFRFAFADGRSVTVIKPITRVADLSLVGPFQLIFVMDRTMAAPSLSAPPIMCNRSIFKEKRNGQSWRGEGWKEARWNGLIERWQNRFSGLLRREGNL